MTVKKTHGAAEPATTPATTVDHDRIDFNDPDAPDHVAVERALDAKPDQAGTGQAE